MKNLKYIGIFIVSLLFISLVSCTKDFETINQNIDKPTEVPSSQMIGAIVTRMADNMYSTFNGSETGMTWAQHESLIQYNDPERYKPRVTTMDGVWNSFYLAASNANSMYKIAETEGNEVNQGVALVLKSYAFHFLTDVYGDIPYTEALLGDSEGNFKPVYDTQETVYNGIVSELDQAIAKLNSGVGSVNSTYDIVYAGDAQKWLKFAYSLKFRALMRISAKKDVSTELQSIVNSGMLFSSNDEEAKLVYLTASPNANPMYETIVDQSRLEHATCNTFIDYLIERNDPRLPVFAQEAVNGGYVGKPSGYAVTPVDGFGYDDVSQIGLHFLQPDAPAYFVSRTELLFLMAEAAKKGYISGGDSSAKAYYEEAILNSFQELGLDLNDYNSFIGTGYILYNNTNALRQIGEQKWVSLFGQGFEAWTEWRRVGYPELSIAIDAYENEIPSRYKYNSDESSLNALNYADASSRIGGDELTTPIWWMQ